MKYEDDGGGHRVHRQVGKWLPVYLAASEPGCGCPCLGRWFSELLQFALAPVHLSPPNDQAVCPVSSPVSVLLVCDQILLLNPLSLIPAGPTTNQGVISKCCILIDTLISVLIFS